MKYSAFSLPLLLSICAYGIDLQTPYEKGNGNQTATYDEIVQYYQLLDNEFDQATLIEQGKTDVGRPLHLFIIDQQKKFSPKGSSKEKAIVMINNGIHPGEPEGIDASMMLARDLLTKSEYKSLLDNTTILIIPVYNVGGCLNRNSTSRTNQNGPEAYGTRANARGLDLNRDFMKSDSKNSKAFMSIFRKWNPHIFIDTHTSNGADYSYTMTLIATQKDKLQPTLSNYMEAEMLPYLYGEMEKDQYPMIPYVHLMEAIPDSGIKDYFDSPRYSTGYSTLFNAVGFVTETHMLKPFDKRLESTYHFLANAITFANDNHKTLRSNKAKADSLIINQEYFDIDWELDLTKFKMIDFTGYAAEYNKSKLTRQEQLSYNRDKPFTKKIRYYNTYKASKTVKKPSGYIIPQAWDNIADLMKINNITLSRLKQDSTIKVGIYRIAEYKTYPKPYQGHYLHHHTNFVLDTIDIQFYEGDYIIKTDQTSNRYIIETLEPEAIDSYFNWGYFDAILRTEGGFSGYVFHDEAEELIEQDPELKKDFYKFRGQNKDAKSNELLRFIFERSDHYKPLNTKYPIARLL